jgi:hypothetical protein
MANESIYIFYKKGRNGRFRREVKVDSSVDELERQGYVRYEVTNLHPGSVVANYIKEHVVPFLSVTTEGTETFDLSPVIIIIEKEQQRLLRNLCYSSGVQEYEGFIFLLVAKIQKVYAEYICGRYKRLSESSTVITNFSKNIKGLEKAIKSVHKDMPARKRPNKLILRYEQIEDDVTISDPFLISWVLEAFQKSVGENDEWEEKLSMIPYQMYGSAPLIKTFKKEASKVLHVFFKHTSMADVKSETTAEEMLTIAQILQIIGVDFYDQGGRVLKTTFAPDLYDIKKQVRNLVTRK